MRHQRHRRSLGVTVEHRKAMLANMVCSLVDHNRVTTTLARAKEASKVADRMVTLAKRGTLHSRRQIISTLRSKGAASKLVDEFAPLFKERKGGYTRVLKYKRRVGDNAQLAILEFTEFPAVKEIKPKKESKKATKKKKPEETSKEEPVKEEKKAEKVKEVKEEQPAEKKPEKKSFFDGFKKKFGKDKK